MGELAKRSVQPPGAPKPGAPNLVDPEIDWRAVRAENRRFMGLLAQTGVVLGSLDQAIGLAEATLTQLEQEQLALRQAEDHKLANSPDTASMSFTEAA